MAGKVLVVLAAFVSVSIPVMAFEAPGSQSSANASAQAQKLPVLQDGLTGAVLDPTGAPVAGAKVRVAPVNGDVPQDTVTDGNGEFSFAGLAPQRYRVVVTSPRWAPVATTIDVSRLTVGSLEIRFESLALTREITVSATRSARNVQRVPGEVSVVERVSLDKAQARSLDDVLRYEPGIEMGATRRLLETPTIRGFDSSRVLVVRDGARVSQFTSSHRGSLFLDVNDVERVEVVRGPASALYGSGALGGVLSITSPDPVDLLEPGQSVGGSISSMYSSAYGELMLSPRVYGSTVGGYGFALGYTGRRTDGLVDVAGDVGQIDFAEEDIDAFDGRFVAAAGRSGSLRVSVNSWRQQGHSSTNLSNEIVEPSEQVRRSTRQQTITVSYQGRGDAWWREELQASGYYSDMDLDETRPSDERVDQIGFRSWGFDVRNTARLGSTQQLTYGVEMFRDKESSDRDGNANSLFPPGEQTQIGLYVQDELELAGGQLILVPGLRWDAWDSSTDDPEIADRSDHRPNPKLGATFEVFEGLVVSANYAEGFRAPNFQDLFISGTHFNVPLGPGMNLLGIFTPNPVLDPETSRNVDVGLRYRRRDLSGSVAYYRAGVDDFIDFEVANGFIPPGTVLLTFSNQNIHRARLEGIEASFRWEIDANWGVRANYSEPRGEDAVTGEPLGGVPPAKTVLGLEFRDSGVGARIGGNARIVSDFDRVPEGVDPEDGYTLFDIHTAWTPSFSPDLTFRFNIYNVADREYRVPLFGTPGAGRDVRVGATLSLGKQ